VSGFQLFIDSNGSNKMDWLKITETKKNKFAQRMKRAKQLFL
jgi:hypothetical protein